MDVVFIKYLFVINDDLSAGTSRSSEGNHMLKGWKKQRGGAVDSSPGS